MTELYHHGIKGQRWGVRRYQNKDRTLTNTGKKRYRSAQESDRQLMSRDWNDLYDEIRKKSGDWYSSKGVSNEFKKAISEHKKQFTNLVDKLGSGRVFGSKDYADMNRDYIEKLSGIALKDLGYYNTKRGRQYLIDHDLIRDD